ncbi:CotH kinase family protein [Algoriphagus sanaruensis]|uniref:Spore coat protein CotH n=1 Tax=Algoriphagus sanaruensis TaxID=1727163 RepID=A0A142ERX3_9BACT|nr:CotH kinase family protein [Algoriphagus sanaruensis]AMQ57878.1 hypothetical protein AO498_15600 [Algoriphagus sanaruensis]
MNRVLEKWSLFGWVLMLLLLGCKDPEIAPVVKGDDGVVFAVDTKDSQIPYIVVDTKGKEILYEPGVLAEMKIYNKKKLELTQGINIEFRGKTSFRLSDKKGYNFETVDGTGEGVDVELLGLPAEEDWRFVGHVVNLNEKYAWDRSLIFNHVGYEFSRMIGKYASRGKFVELEVNGEYLGVYLLQEKLKRDSNRIDIKSLNEASTNLTGGYILKIDKADAGPEHDGKPISYFMNNWEDDARYTAQNSFRSNYDINGNRLTFPAYSAPYHPQQFLETYFTYEYPKAEDITASQKDYIANYIEEFEAALLADDFSSDLRTYTDYIEVSTFVDYFLVNELTRNVDAYRLSTYLVKNRDGKLEMGPVWDMNLAFDEGGRIPMDGWVMNYNNYVSNDPWMIHFWWPKLLADPQFRQQVKTRWNAIRKDVWSNASLQKVVDDAVSYLRTNGAVERNYAKWDKGLGVDYDGIIISLKDYINQRSAWMDSEIGSW